METRNFLGRDMNEALRALRATLGPDALILQTRRVPTDSGTKVEITAAQEEAQDGKAVPVMKEPLSRDVPLPRPQRAVEKTQEHKELYQLRNLLLGDSTLPTDTAGDLQELRRDIAEMRSLFRWFAPAMGRGTVMEELMIQGASPEIIARLTQEVQMHDGTPEREQMRRALTQMIATSGDVESKGLRRECLALIGPTGVGKTTTVVKLTTHLVRRGDRRVGWISLDNRRIAGSEQLVVYAGVLGIPCEVVDTKDGLSQALERFSACDLVLIDTAGINPRDEKGLAELAQFTHHIPDLKRTLLLSAATNGRDLMDWSMLYGKVGFDSLLFTKLDESRYFGSLLNTSLACRRPLSYFTRGQSITNSLELANPETLAHLLLP